MDDRVIRSNVQYLELQEEITFKAIMAHKFFRFDESHQTSNWGRPVNLKQDKKATHLEASR